MKEMREREQEPKEGRNKRERGRGRKEGREKRKVGTIDR